MLKYVVEFIGTLWLVFVILTTGNWAAIGGALGVACLLGGPISKGAFNPAVTLAYYAAGTLPKSDVIPYTLVQFLGGVCAVGLHQMSNPA